MGSQSTKFKELDTDRENGCIRSVDHPYSKDGGLAVLYGNIATKGSIVKTAGIDSPLFTFSGIARVFESQEDAVEGILGDTIKHENVIVITHEGPKGGPGMQEMLYPTSYLNPRDSIKKCALITDGRFSGGTSGLSIGHVSPEAASGGEIALVRNGDRIEIDIANRKMNVLLSENELNDRKNVEYQKEKELSNPNP